MVCERSGAIALNQMRTPDLSDPRAHFLRGALDTMLTLPDLLVTITTKSKEFDDRASVARNGPAAERHDPAIFWGSEYYRTEFASDAPTGVPLPR